MSDRFASMFVEILNETADQSCSKTAEDLLLWERQTRTDTHTHTDVMHVNRRTHTNMWWHRPERPDRNNDCFVWVSNRLQRTQT